MIRIIKKIITWITTLLLLTIAGVSAYVYYNQELIIQRFIEEFNKKINTPIHVDKIEVSIWEHFPFLSVNMQKVRVEESYNWSDASLLEAEIVSFAFNPIDIINQEYILSRLFVQNGHISIKIDRNGVNNFSIFTQNTNKEAQDFTLDKVSLINATATYEDLYSNKKLKFSSNQISASINGTDVEYKINAKGDLHSEYVSLKGSLFLENMDLKVNSDFKYNSSSKRITIHPSALNHLNSTYILEGWYGLENGGIEMTLKNDNTNIQQVIALIPSRYTSGLNKYQSKGDGYFKLTLAGKFEDNTYPGINIQFNLTNGQIFHPQISTTLDSVSLTGSYQSEDMMDVSQASLKLSEINGRLENEPFQAKFAYSNFEDPYLQLQFKGELTTEWLYNVISSRVINQPQGKVASDISLSGRINNLKSKATIQKVTTSGDLTLKDVGFTDSLSNIPVTNLNGNLIFNNNDLAINNFSGNVGSSDFKMNGILKNFASYLLLDNQPIGIEADLTSSLIDLDELLSKDYTTNNDSAVYAFSISPNLQLKFNCSIEQLKFRRFLGNNIKGDLLVKDQIASTNSISLETMDGRLSLSGSANASSNDSIYVYTDGKLDQIALDQLFFVFGNFKQDWLTDKHLKGDVKAEIGAFLSFDNALNLNTNSLIADLKAQIIGGELNNFEPMQNLAKYIDEKELNALRFGELQNEIHVENETIYIPKMVIRSNATTITIGGTHTFDQHIDYTVAAPINNKKKQDSDAAFGAIEEDEQGGLRVHLKITGTTDDYHVNYDGRAQRKELANSFKKEVKELKDSFRTKGEEKKKEVVLEDDEYFDW